MRQKICGNHWVIYSMSPTLARAHYSCPDNAIGLVSTGQAVEGSLAEFFLLLPMFMSIKRYVHSTFLINWILIQIETQWTSKLPSKMPVFVEKYAICALCWNMQKNEATCEICSNRVIRVKLACLDKSAVLVCFSIDHFDTVQVYHMIFITLTWSAISDLLQMLAALVFLPWYGVYTKLYLLLTSETWWRPQIGGWNVVAKCQYYYLFCHFFICIKMIKYHADTNLMKLFTEQLLFLARSLKNYQCVIKWAQWSSVNSAFSSLKAPCLTLHDQCLRSLKSPCLTLHDQKSLSRCTHAYTHLIYCSMSECGSNNY